MRGRLTESSPRPAAVLSSSILCAERSRVCFIFHMTLLLETVLCSEMGEGLKWGGSPQLCL